MSLFLYCIFLISFFQKTFTFDPSFRRKGFMCAYSNMCGDGYCCMYSGGCFCSHYECHSFCSHGDNIPGKSRNLENTDVGAHKVLGPVEEHHEIGDHYEHQDHDHQFIGQHHLDEIGIHEHDHHDEDIHNFHPDDYVDPIYFGHQRMGPDELYGNYETYNENGEMMAVPMKNQLYLISENREENNHPIRMVDSNLKDFESEEAINKTLFNVNWGHKRRALQVHKNRTPNNESPHIQFFSPKIQKPKFEKPKLFQKFRYMRS